MTTAIASGLGATLGWGKETTVGTSVAPTEWAPFLSESFKGNKRTVESAALYGGAVQLASHRAMVGFDAKGGASFELQDRSMGLLLEAMFGAVPTYNAGTPNTLTYILGTYNGIGLTVQVGVPMTSGTLQAFTYGGCKVTEWELSAQALQMAKLNVTLDGMTVATATSYTAPTYATGVTTLNFAQGALLTASAAPVGIIRSASLKGTAAFATDRFQMGSTTKSEALINNWLKISLTATVEFANLSDFYTAYAADTSLTYSLGFTSGSSTGLVITGTAGFLNASAPDVKGPDIITQEIELVGLGSGNTLTAVYSTLDTAA
jgi:hypothetical protein